MNDQEIIDLFWIRSEQAIEEVNQAYSRYCGSIARNILHDARDCEECLSDTWMQAWNAIPPARPNHLAAFLGKLTRALALNRLREQNAQKRGGGAVHIALDELSECIPADGRNPDAAVEEQELAREINLFLHTLPQEKRVAFVLRYWQMEPVKTIAERLGCRESRVKSMLFQTRKQLKNYLRQEGITV